MRPDNSGRDIVFTDVEFKYPARPDVPILQGLSLTIRKGETVALVGTSGCGKSTCIQLVQRFYDPENGKIELGESRKNEFFTLFDLQLHLTVLNGTYVFILPKD